MKDLIKIMRVINNLLYMVNIFFNHKSIKNFLNFMKKSKKKYILTCLKKIKA